MYDLLMEWVAFLEKSYYWVIGSVTKLDEFSGEMINKENNR